MKIHFEPYSVELTSNDGQTKNFEIKLEDIDQDKAVDAYAALKIWENQTEEPPQLEKPV